MGGATGTAGLSMVVGAGGAETTLQEGITTGRVLVSHLFDIDTPLASPGPRSSDDGTDSLCLRPVSLDISKLRVDFSPDVGACGNPNSADDMIVAVSHLLYDSYPGATPNPNDNP